MTDYINCALSALWYFLIFPLGWPHNGRKQAQYCRARALPNWAISVRHSLHARPPVDISVVITCFNYEAYLELAVKSVIEAASFNRDLKIEVIIFDDRSTDHSFKVANALLQSCLLPISVIRPWWNVGVSRGRNLCLLHAKGDFVFILDADNTLSKDGLTKLYSCAIIEKADAAYGPIRCILTDGKENSWVSNTPFDPDTLRKQGPYIDAMALFRKATLVSLGGYDINLLKTIGGWEDYDLWLRLANDQYKVSFCKDSVIGNYLVKQNSMVQKISYKDRIEALNLLRTSVPTQKFIPNNNLIFDLGFHRGEDTSHYLELGFNVVAIEADPNLYQFGLENFSKEIYEKRITLINAAVVSRQRNWSQAKISFYPHSKNTLWGSVDIDFVYRNTDIHKSPHDPEITINTISLEELVERYGCPIFLKVDIEGMDAEVVEDLNRIPVVPEFVSWETGKKSLFRVLYTHMRLFGLGYRRFRVTQQMYSPNNSAAQSSGPIPSHHPSQWRGVLSAMLTHIFLFGIYKLIGPRSIFLWAENHTISIINTLPRYLRKEMSRRSIAFPGWFDSHAALPKK